MRHEMMVLLVVEMLLLLLMWLWLVVWCELVRVLLGLRLLLLHVLLRRVPHAHRRHWILQRKVSAQVHCSLAHVHWRSHVTRVRRMG
jgi:hypothetical protein